MSQYATQVLRIRNAESKSIAGATAIRCSCDGVNALTIGAIVTSPIRATAP